MSVESKWVVNGITEDTNNITPIVVTEGGTITIQNTDARMVLGGLYRNGGPYIIFQNFGTTKTIIVKRTNLSLKGQMLLKLNAYRSDWSSFRIDVPVTVV